MPDLIDRRVIAHHHGPWLACAALSLLLGSACDDKARESPKSAEKKATGAAPKAAPKAAEEGSGGKPDAGEEPSSLGAFCGEGGWCPAQNSSLDVLNAVGGIGGWGAGKVAYGIGDEGRIWRYADRKWALDWKVEGDGVVAYGGRNADEVVALTSKGALLTREGDARWTISGVFEGGNARVMDVWIAARDNVWAWFEGGPHPKGTLAWWDGTTWSVVASPPELSAGTKFRAIAPLKGGEAMVAPIKIGPGESVYKRVRVEGAGGKASYRWDKGNLMSNSDARVWATHEGVVYAFRDNQIVRQLGGGWEKAYQDPAEGWFNWVRGYGNQALALFQEQEEDKEKPVKSHFIRFDGNNWVPFGQTIPSVHSYKTILLDDEAITGRTNGEAFAWIGKGWGMQLELNGIHGRKDGSEVYAVGNGGLVLRLGDKGWAREDAGTFADLFAVWVDESGLVVAVGREGTVAMRKEGRWELEAEPTELVKASFNAEEGGEALLSTVWGSGPDDIYVSGPGVSMPRMRYNGKGWDEIKEFGARTIYGFSKEKVFAVHFGELQGVLGDVMATSSASLFSDMWGLDENNLLIADRSVVKRYINKELIIDGDLRGLAPPRKFPFKVVGISGNDKIIHAVTDRGIIFTKKDDRWALSPVASQGRLRDVFTDSKGRAWAVGEHGLILEKAP